MVVSGAENIALDFGISEKIIALTIVAAGTSLPELASSVMAARKGEHDIALGNVVGSNFFNTLAVVGLAAAIHPMPVASEVLARDAAVMAGLTLLLFVFAWSGRRIIRPEGAVLLTAYAGYTAYLVATAF